MEVEVIHCEMSGVEYELRERGRAKQNADCGGDKISHPAHATFVMQHIINVARRMGVVCE